MKFLYITFFELRLKNRLEHLEIFRENLKFYLYETSFQRVKMSTRFTGIKEEILF